MSDNYNTFLDVEVSLKGKRWVDRLSDNDRNQALAIAQETGMPELLARVLCGRGVAKDNAEQFLNPNLKDLMPDPSTMTDMDKAVDVLVSSIIAKDRVAIFGDYDVDGASSSALLSRFLTALDITNEIYIPDRIFEGYGPNPNAMKTLVDAGAKLIVTVDCGSTSFEALEAANKLGVKLLVIDHHQCGDELPIADAIVNPNRQDDLSDLGTLCAAGVVFMVLVAVQRELRKRSLPVGPNLMEMLDIVALATVCDVVPLIGLNRAFVVKGLNAMRKRKNAGISALSKVSRLDGPIQPYHLGFLLGPRINAGGRIGDAALGSRLLTLEDEYEAEQIAEQLEGLNKERQEIEAVMLEEAINEAEAEIGLGDGPSVLVTARTGWHPGIVGLLASRLKDRFSRPAFAVAFDPSGKGAASGRSISGVDIGKAVRDAVDEGILVKGGGHAMAAGLTIQKDRLGDLRAFFEDALSEQIAKARQSQVTKIDGALTARGANLRFIELLATAGPYGQGHSQPVFAFPNHLIQHSRLVGKDHISLTLKSADGTPLKAIAFRAADEDMGRALMDGQGRHFHFVGTLGTNTWQGRQSVQLRVMDAAPV
ncbi:MAG: single-stranded-DNA-specific exonuclease RecJ [Hyphomicrobiales bacterium]|nr:single-stranded-DNA-specific exonuclease RecJ [Hyphomicrobiales bacterium]PCH49521.1 MAG: single-stranded-DNA-specific exonuclease RecJ [Hyphomicrobiales bacterium]